MHEQENDFSLKNFFIPLTTFKAIHIIVIVGLVVFANCLFNQFVWDDISYVLQTGSVYGLDSVKLFGVNLYNSYGYYRPIPATYAALLFTFFGSTPFFYHFIQVLLHILNGVFLFIFFKSLFKRIIALFLSLIFLVHPMQVESVSYISQATSVLFFLFGMIAFLISNKSNTSLKYVIIFTVSLTLCLLSKESGLLFIPLIIFYRYLFKKGKVVFFTLLSFIPVTIYSVIRFVLVKDFFYNVHFVPISRIPLPTRLLNIPEILLYYLKTFLFPVNLAISQNWVVTTPSLSHFFLPLVLLLVVLVICIWFGFYFFKTKKYFKEYLFFVFWFIGGIAFYIQLLPLDMTVADRWFYLPMVGLLGIVGLLVQDIYLNKYKHFQKSIIFIFILIIGLSSLRTIVRNFDWQNAMTLNTHDSQIIDDYNIESNLAWEFLSQKNIDAALLHYKKSVALYPYEVNLNQIGYIYELKGNISEAKKYYLKALSTQSPVILPLQHEEAMYLNISRFELYFGDPLTARKYIKQGLEEYPKSFTLWILLGLDEYKLQHKSQAIAAVTKAYQLMPGEDIKNLSDQMNANQAVQVPIQTFYSL